MKFHPDTYIKFFPRDMRLRDLQYTLGLNKDPIPFNSSPLCLPGGLYYTSFKTMGNFVHYGPIIGIIKIPIDTPIIAVGDDKFKSPEIFIEETYEFEEFIYDNTLYPAEKSQIESDVFKMIINGDIYSKDSQMNVVKRDGRNIRYIKNPSEESQLEAVRQNANNIKFIKNPTEEVLLTMVRRNGHNIHLIEDPSPAVQLAAAINDLNSIRYIRCYRID
jgi:hypothetical protein